MSDKIAEIRARHERIQRDCTLATPPGSMAGQVAAVDAHEDRATLLAEVDRLRAENERLLQAIGLVTTTVPDMEIDIENPVGMMQRVVAEVERLTGKLKLVADALNDTISKYHEVGDQVDRLDAENERLRAAARNALNELNCIEEEGGHRCIRCDSEIDEGYHVRLALRIALEGKP